MKANPAHSFAAVVAYFLAVVDSYQNPAAFVVTPDLADIHSDPFDPVADTLGHSSVVDLVESSTASWVDHLKDRLDYP